LVLFFRRFLFFALLSLNIGFLFFFFLSFFLSNSTQQQTNL
jgi:hypothetical protein